MERIQHLIEKLNQQHVQGATPEQMLLTVQLLQTELLQQQSPRLGTSRVAVTLPVNYHFSEEVVRPAKPLPVEKPAAKEEAPTQPTVQKEQTPPPYRLQKPTVMEQAFAPEVAPQAMEENMPPVSKPFTPATPVFSPAAKEIHEVLTSRKDSLNDRLKEEKVEVAHKLKESPIKDLRKAIGINDRFVFINDLFKGDEPMYERSLKTINNFNIFSEAEFWMRRELRLKLAWDDDNPHVQHFYDLVRRRFS
jgi:hypothetical protein